MARRSRKLIKLLLLLLIFSGIVPFVYPFGWPLLKLNDINLPTLKAMGEKLPDLPEIGKRSGQTVTVYRWREKNGSWSFGSEPPAGVKYDAISVYPDANLIPGLAQQEKGETADTPVASSSDSDKPASLMGYSAEDVSKIMQSAREARTAIEQRYKQEEVIINEIK